MATPTAPRDKARDERRPLTPEEQAHLLDCQLAEQLYQVFHLDADSCPVPPCIAHLEARHDDVHDC